MSDKINVAFGDWVQEMKKLSDYFPEIWPSEDILSWGSRMEKEQKKYNLNEDEWVELEGRKTAICLNYGRKLPDKKKNIKCPKFKIKGYHLIQYVELPCYADHPFEEDYYTCDVTGRYPICDYGMLEKKDFFNPDNNFNLTEKARLRILETFKKV